MFDRVIAEFENHNQAERYTATLKNNRFLEFAVISTLTNTIQTSICVAVHPTDLTVFGDLPPVANKAFLTFITDTFDRLGSKRLLVDEPQNTNDLIQAGYQLTDPADKVLIPYNTLKSRLAALANTNNVRKKDFTLHQEKLNSGEWQFVAGHGKILQDRVNLQKLHDFYAQHCAFAKGGFKDQYTTYGIDGIAARFFAEDEAIVSFVLQTNTGDIIAANHLLFTPTADNHQLAYCYDNVVHDSYRSHDVTDSQHVYQFFLTQISSYLETEKLEPKAAVFILGGQGQAANGKHIAELLLKDMPQSTSQLLFKGAPPTELMVALIHVEKDIVKFNLLTRHDKNVRYKIFSKHHPLPEVEITEESRRSRSLLVSETTRGITWGSIASFYKLPEFTTENTASKTTDVVDFYYRNHHVSKKFN